MFGIEFKKPDWTNFHKEMLKSVLIWAVIVTMFKPETAEHAAAWLLSFVWIEVLNVFGVKPFASGRHFIFWLVTAYLFIEAGSLVFNLLLGK